MQEEEVMFSLPRSSSITTEEFELVAGNQLTDERFAALCNAVALSTNGRMPTSLLPFWERVRVLPGGIHPDWQVETYGNLKGLLPLFGPGLNAVECRRVPTLSTGAQRSFSHLVNRVQGAAGTTAGQAKSRPGRYLLFTNVRLDRGPESGRRQVERSVRLGSDTASGTEVEVVGAEQLVAMINQRPYVRSVFFDDTGFQLWPEAWHEHTRPKLFGAHVDLVGRGPELIRLQTLIRDPMIRGILIRGPRYAGKTRLALEATSHWQRETVFVRGAQLDAADDLLKVATPGKEILVLVDDCTAEQAEDVAQVLSERTDLKAILVLSAADRSTTDFGRTAGAIREMYVGPLPAPHVNTLVEQVVAGLDDDTKLWISHEAEGNPGMILAAADLRHRLKRSAPSLLDALVLGMESRIRREFGDNGIRILRILSLMTEVDTSDQKLTEISTICRILGERLQPEAVMKVLPRLELAGVVSQVGHYVEVVPQYLANHLAMDALRSHSAQAGSLINALGPSGRLRVGEHHPVLEDEREALPYARQNRTNDLQLPLQSWN
jgi:hypothetical protein